MNNQSKKKEIPYGSYKKKKDVSTLSKFASIRPNTCKSNKKMTGKDYKKAGLPNFIFLTSILTVKSTRTCKKMKSNGLGNKK